MNDLYLKNALVYREGVFSPGSVCCKGGLITAIDRPDDDLPTLDCAGLRLSPGWIDPHTHGGLGVDVNSADARQLAEISAYFASQGVTSWLASVLTDTPEQTLRCIGHIRETMGQTGGANLCGIHLEGPFLAREYKGAMPEHLLKGGDAALFYQYQRAAGGAVKYITVSPEVEHVLELIQEISGQIAVAIGHSGADYDTAMRAVEMGARCCTHTFNAMKLFHQHQPSVMGAALESDIWCEAICDGLHLHPGAVRLLLKTKGYDKVIAVTDSIMAAGLPDGEYRLGVNRVVVSGGDAKLAEGGVRAGSTLTAVQALHNLIDFTGEPVERLIPLLSANAADALRMSDRGRIAVGNRADFVLLDESLEVEKTIVGGVVVYNRK